MATLLPEDGKVVHEVKQVFIHIPAEQSAARFELKIAGLIKVLTKVSSFPMLHMII